MIEKKIHYCWFGGNPKPKSVLKCIDSWKKFLPDYEIIEWNESNFDFNFCQYVTEAYSVKKWAFVSDVARLKIIYENGGIYFDTDVEVLKSFDELMSQEYFLGLEEPDKINTGIGFGAVKGCPVIKAMLDIYNGKHFINDSGKKPITCPVFNTKAVEGLGVKLNGEVLSFMGGTIYPEDYFSPISMKDGRLRITRNTYSIHHFANSWMPWHQKLRKLARTKLRNPYTLFFWNIIKKIVRID